MSAVREFDALVFAYLDGDATPQQVVDLRDRLRRDPALRARLAALVRLHRAQSAALVRARTDAFGDALAGLRRFAGRAGRCLAHACVLALVVVELDVNVPGIDSRSWFEPEPSVVLDAPVPDAAEATFADEADPDDDMAPLPDVREADFLES